MWERLWYRFRIFFKLSRKINAIIHLTDPSSLQLADHIWLLDGKGGLAVGTADDLIKEGAIGRAFDSSEVRFSAERGRFELVG